MGAHEPDADAPRAPGRAEAVAAAVAGPAFAASALLLRDATLLPPSLFDALAAALAALGLAPLAHRLKGALAATLVRGAGIALGVLLASPALVPPFDRAVPPIALWIVGATLLQANARSDKARWIPEALGLAALAGGVALALAVSGSFPEPGRLRVAVVAASVVAAVGLVARALLRRSRWSILAPAPVGVLLVAAFGAVYLAYRGLVAERVANLPLYEWTLAVGAAGLLLARIRTQARDRAASDAWSSAARRHAQDVAPVYDRRMAPHVAAIGRYLDTGAGYAEYRAAIERAVPDAPPALRSALDAAAEAPRGARGRQARRAAYEARVLAHSAVLRELTNASRGLPDGSIPPRVRAHP